MGARITIWALTIGIAGLLAWQYFHEPSADAFADPGRCAEFTPYGDAVLVAHAGGGLARGTYTNSREAMDLAVEHGFELIEVDFFMAEGDLSLGHDPGRPSDLTLADFRRWVEDHPQVSIVTDIKDGNATGLPFLAGLEDRLIVQIYDPSEFDAVRARGIERIIFTAYNMNREDWQEEVNALDLYAVTVPAARRHLAEGVTHPVFFHTVNKPFEAYGLYTDCLIPPQDGFAADSENG